MKFKLPNSRCILLATLLIFLLGGLLQAGEFFVSKTGSDKNDGTSRTAAFATVQKGLDALAPGDTLTILPGEYFETVERKGLGDKDHETTLRAALSGTVVLRGDLPAPGFQPADGFRRVYVTDFEQEVQAVHEIATLHSLRPAPSAAELEFHPGSYYYDAEAKKLYISSTDFRTPDEHAYSISVTRSNGLFLQEPVRVVIDGIAVRGFNSAHEEKSSPGKFTVWGILLFKAQHCVIRNAEAYLNSGGIAVASSLGHNVIEDCIAGGNNSFFGGSGGNIVVFAPENDVIRRSQGYRSTNNGLRLYGAMDGPSSIEDSLAWGNHADLFIKGPNVDRYGVAKNSVAVGAGHLRNTKNTLIGQSNIYQTDQKAPPDSIRLRSERVDQNDEFADPINFDYRLQATSRFRKSGPEGTARGPYPYKANIFYVKPDGNDGADGLAMASAWKTVARATRNLRPGDTVYLEEGIYHEGITLKEVGKQDGKPISLRARGTGRVVLTGPSQIKDGWQIDLQRLHFASGVTVDTSTAITFNNCRFYGKEIALKATDSPKLRVTHCEFTGFEKAALSLEECPGSHLDSNLFDNRNSIAVDLRAGERDELTLYSDYNSYTTPSQAWRIDGKPKALEALAAYGERYSIALRPRYELKEGYPKLINAGQFSGNGALGQRIGFEQQRLEDRIHMTRPVVHSVGPTTANIEWLLSDKAEALLAWGETPACENKTAWRTNEYGAFSLTGLKPETTYYFRIESIRWPRSLKRDPGPAQVVDPSFEIVSFTTTASQAKPQTYYVAPNGSNSHDGLSRKNAWQTVAHAAAKVGPGDTVLIAEGTYAERVRLRTSGLPGLPITFRSLPGEKVVFGSAGKLINSAWVINGKNHIVIDGLYFSQFGPGGGSKTSPRIFDIYRSNNITISRCFYDGRGPGYSNGFLTAIESKDLKVNHCVLISGFNHIGITACPDLRLEHNVFVVPMIQATMIGLGENNKNHLRYNIFTDSSAFKVKVNLHEWSGNPADLIDDDNCYFPRVPDEERKLFWLLSFQENGKTLGHTRMSLAEYRRRARPSTSIIADPGFAYFKMHPPQDDGKYPFDVLLKPSIPLDFPDFFSTNPALTKRSIGLQPEKFRTFHFATTKVRD